MDYKLLHTEDQKFLAIAKRFSNDIINDESNHDIPDFWDECGKKGLIERLLDLRCDGKRDLYGLCSPSREGEDTFEYGIGVLVDGDTSSFDIDTLTSQGYRIWDVCAGEYVVFECIGDDGDCISETWNKFYNEFLPHSELEARHSTDYEVYYQNGKDGLFCELWVPIKSK